MYSRRYKRLLDLLISLVLLSVLVPLLAVVAILIWAVLGRPILFSQQRPGIDEKPFRVYKFRTMTVAYDRLGECLPDEERLTSFGRFLRNASLDELPELWNVLRGEMSIVGPRPLLMAYLSRYDDCQKRRHEVRPGITGLAQIRGRNAMSWEVKFELDLWYVDHVSFWTDIQILALTVWKLILREGINQPGHATMEEFLGSGN